MVSAFVGITIDKDVRDTIEAKRGDLTRSKAYQKLIRFAVDNGGLDLL